MADFLLEIGCEEIPARMLDTACAQLASKLQFLLVNQFLHIGGQDFAVKYSTPRRLAVLIHDVAEQQRDTQEELTGPAFEIAFKDGKPTAAALGFVKKSKVPIEHFVELAKTASKGAKMMVLIPRPGRAAIDVLAEQLPKEISSLNWPKNMYWRVGAPERFVRPVRWITALLGSELVPLEFAGVKTGKTTRGHRVLGADLTLEHAADYRAALEKVSVVVDRCDREQRIRQALAAALITHPGARVREDDDLLNTVVNLTEWPSVILGAFDKSYLDLPEEVLVTVMRDHQKYFAVEDANGKLLPNFLTVLNTGDDKDGLIRHGNERVLRARFNDARFFWQTDQKIPLSERVKMLHSVTFQKELGSYHSKADRIAKLAAKLAQDLQADGVLVQSDAVQDAAWLCKTDLTTELVKEFTELQGIIGGLYAKAQGQREAIANAVYDHYRPENMDAPAPRSIEGAVLSIADKADSIAGMFALGQIPTGSKDPLALRRQANGIVKTLAEHRLRLRLTNLLTEAVNGYRSAPGKVHEFFQKSVPDQVTVWISTFFRERLEFYLRDVRGFSYDVVNAVLTAGADDVVDALARCEAVSAVRTTEDFEAISISFKRMKNILRQASDADKSAALGFEPALVREPAEQQLAGVLPHIAGVADRLREEGKYLESLKEVSKLRLQIDAFFDKVMVMDPDDRIRANRLALLQKLVMDFSTIADFSEIVTEKDKK